MIIIFIFSLSVLIYTFLGYPMILVLLSFLFGKHVEKKDFYPSVSILISAYNEENVIKQKIENSLNLDYPKDKLEIIVASESTDKTNEIVTEYKEKGVVLYAFEKREGKSATLYRTVPLAKGEIIIFSDANAMYEKDSVKKITRNFYDKRIGCVSGRLRYLNPKESNIGEGERAYWEHDIFLKKIASKLLSLGGGVNGSILAIRKELYNPINKYRGDDFEISNRIEINGYGVIIEPEAISYEEASTNSKQEFKRKVRLATWNLKSSFLLLREALKKRKLVTAFLIFSHRLLRYTTPIWLILLLLSNIFLLDTGLYYLFSLQVIFYLIAFIGFVAEKNNRKINSLLLVPFYFCMVNYAALFAIFKNIFTKTEVLWEKVR
jgi:cellulose synthase/poly-beta-1,6-N-acetylglucosamine synthase-like glycosyltransferase